MLGNILVADDNPWILEDSVREVGKFFPDFHIDKATSPKKCSELLRDQAKEYDVVILDLSFSKGKMEGYDLIQLTSTVSPSSLIVVLSTFSGDDIISECMRLGAHDFVIKSESGYGEKLGERISSFLKRSEKIKCDKVNGKKLATLSGATFRSVEMAEVFSEVAKIRDKSRIHVLITGEAGVGKELIAESISRRYEGAPYFAINASCIGQDRLESDLFGHEKGAYTGADKMKAGLFELTRDGDLFIDEIATLSIDQQAKLLRVLQKGEFYRMGGSKLLKTNARVITATNENLEEMVMAGTFRKDLLQRLSRYTINVPPLRERKPDVIPIANSILFSIDGKKLEISNECKKIFLSYPWPGNVRELEDLVRSMAITATDGEISLGDIPKTFFQKRAKVAKPKDEVYSCNFNVPLKEAIQEFEKFYIKRTASRLAKLNPSKLATRLSIPRTTLDRRIMKLGIDLG